MRAPILHQLPLHDLVGLGTRPGPVVLLDTARPDRHNRFSYLFLDPIDILEAQSCADIPLFLKKIDHASRRSWIAGALSYNAGFALDNAFDGITGDGGEVGPSPAWFGVFDRPYIFDHTTGTWDRHLPFAQVKVNEDSPSAPDTHGLISVEYQTNRSAYRKAITAIRNKIARGETYQVNFTFDLLLTARISPWRLYRHLRSLQPVPYAAFMRTSNHEILSFSPELFFRRDGRTISVQPMKGTARRAIDPTEDDLIREFLKTDPKNRAENLMIVDLLRNDLNRICTRGSVTVKQLFDVETHPTLHQMTSTITGRLNPHVSLAGILTALFPCGSVTGAPKINTMKIIRSLETGDRGWYCGAIGFQSPRGKAVFNVPIRILQRQRSRQNSQWQFRVGSGIVWDSRATSEWDECVVKAGFLTRTPPAYRLLESVLWQGRLVYAADHFQRLRHSAGILGFMVNDAALHELHKEIRRYHCGKPDAKIRILMDAQSSLTWETEPLDTARPRQKPVAVVSVRKIDKNEPLLFHKTTRRPWYDGGMAQIRTGGCFDVIYVNDDGTVAEGARSNVFIKKGALFLTPPLSCGLLPGILRQRLIDKGKCAEAVITRKQLESANEIYCGNSVRGLVRVWLEK